MNKRIKQLMLKMQEGKIIASVAAVTLAFAFGLGLYAFRGAIFVSQDRQDEGGTPSASATQDTRERHPLTGSPLDEPGDLPQVYAVMIDDHVEAHPQSGMDGAFLVIEAPVEGSIPRIEAFFYEGQEAVEQIGPVRSARPYFLDWASELDAMYVHVGGSPEALELIVVGDTFDFNQYWNGPYFWRATTRSAPHNVYTSTDLLKKGLEKEREAGNAPERVLYGVWKFKDGQPDLSSESVGVRVVFSGPTYVAEWVFDEEVNQYTRSFGGKEDLQLDKASVSADNVAIVITETEVVDNVGRLHVRTMGEGDAYVLQDGVKILATWKKSSESERLRFYDRDGNEIEMNAGRTWIEVVGREDAVTFLE